MGDSWRVKQSVLLKEVLGREERPDGEHVHLRGFIAVEGQKIEGRELDPDYVQRYNNGDETVRAQVQRIGDDDDDGGELTGEELDKRAKELDIPGRSTMKADELRKAVAKAEEKQS